MKRLAACLLSLASVGADANDLDGHRLFSLCTEPGYSAACVYYIRGVVDERRFLELKISAHAQVSGIKPDQLKRKPEYCLPASSTMSHHRDAVVAFMKAHPDRRNYFAADLIEQALGSAFPCR